MAENRKTNSKIWIGAGVLAAAVALMGILYFVFRPKPVEGSKEITIEVVDHEAENIVYSFKTDAEYLRQAMEEADGLEFSGAEGEFGLMVTVVNGVTADYNVNGAYWAFYVNGDYCKFGIDMQPVMDGDAFRIVYTADGGQ